MKVARSTCGKAGNKPHSSVLLHTSTTPSVTRDPAYALLHSHYLLS